MNKVKKSFTTITHLGFVYAFSNKQDENFDQKNCASFDLNWPFACTLRHLVATSDLRITLCSGNEVMAVGARGGGNKPTNPPPPSSSRERWSMPRPTICLITAANQQVNATPGRQALVGRDQTADLGDDRCRWKKGNKTLLQRWQRCTRRQIIVNSNLQNSASHSHRLTIMEPLKAM